MARDHELTVEQVRQLWDYDADTGLLTWRAKEVLFYQHRMWNDCWAGKQAGHPDGQGYLAITHREPDGTNRSFKAHRLAWIHYHGKHPIGEVDHIDGDRANNRITNLREASDQHNAWNAKRRKDNQSGIKGVKFVKSRAHLPWVARIWANGKRHFIGGFATKDEAAAALQAFRAQHHGEYANHGTK